MSPKRPSPKPPATASEWKITDEWGIYDPAKAGMPALFARLGRPVLQAPATSSRKERRRALRPERSSEGVGMAIAEARRRAGLDHDDEGARNAPPLVGDGARKEQRLAGGDARTEHPLVGGNPARAMRLALRARAAVNAMGTPAAAPFVAPPQSPIEPAATAAPPADAAPAAPSKRKPRKTASRAAAQGAGTGAEPPQSTVARRPRVRKAAVKSRAPQDAPASEAVGSAAAANSQSPAPPSGVSVAAPTPPAPSPRRPRGPVPLAAWAHAVADQPAGEPRRHPTLGFWRGVFRIPTEVALVEYAHGARIHRLLIETADDPLPDFI